ncbi:MAG: serine hydrolase [Candidatus Xenobia bacterium]
MRRLCVVLWVMLFAVPVQAAPNEALQKKLQSLVAAYRPNMRIGVAVVHVADGATAGVDADSPYPLASVFKLPVMVELAHQLQNHEGNLSLETPITISERNKCVGSGELKHKADGSTVSLREAVELMETISDNTAADLVFKRIGLDSVNRLMRSLGLTHTDIYLTNREAWLVSLGKLPELRGKSEPQIASWWLTRSEAERHKLAARVDEVNRGLSLGQFQAAENASEVHDSYADDVAVAAATDNTASPSDLATLLSKLGAGQILNPQWTTFCLDVLSGQQFNSRIPRLLPRGTRTWHKTGTIAGVVNDAGLIEVHPGDRIAVAVLVRDIAAGHQHDAEIAIARIARAAYDAYRQGRLALKAAEQDKAPAGALPLGKTEEARSSPP